MSLKQNIIYIYFKGKHQVISKSQYQYNHGQYLYFADLNLPQVFEVHFSSKDKGESKTQIGSGNLVEIPDEYFWNGALQIYAWIYLHNEVNDGETVYEVKIPLMKRAKPTDEEPLPVQQSTIDRAIAELNNAVDITTENANKTDSDKTIVANIKEDVIDLKEEIDSTATTINQKAQETIDAAERGETSAQNAATSERQALNYSQQAEQSAQDALEYKNIAQQKSEIATNASVEALGYRDEALEAKNQTIQAKQDTVDYRDETKGYRDETLNLKNNVQTLKGEVEDIADTVNEDAQSASQSASSANPTARTNCKCSIYKESAEAYSDTNRTYMVVCVNLDSVWIRDNRYTDAESFKSAVDGVQLCYEIAEPQTYQLTPHEVNSLLGVNNIFADTGDISCEYRADPDLYIQRKMPEVPVDDVQINGTSIVEDGVANVPIATATGRLGVCYAQPTFGTNITQGGALFISGASLAEVKLQGSGNSQYRPITPNSQHLATFYGLAKSAGDTTQSQSSNAVGTYTGDAKIAIQKMLGIYEAPWELIREDTFTNDTEAPIEITTDDNGNPFELTDIRMSVETPQQDAVSGIGAYGGIEIYNGTRVFCVIYIAAWTQSANTQAHYAYGMVEQQDGLVTVSQVRQGTSGNAGNVAHIMNPANGSSYPWKETTVQQAFDKIKIKAATGSVKICIYGRRKWQ